MLPPSWMAISHISPPGKEGSSAWAAPRTAHLPQNRDTLAEPAWLRDSQPRMATPLRLENFGRIDFSLGRWITRGKKTPKSMTPYAKVPGELVRIFFHSLLWPQRSLLYGFPPHCTKQSVFLTLQLDRICQSSSDFHAEDQSRQRRTCKRALLTNMELNFLQIRSSCSVRNTLCLVQFGGRPYKSDRCGHNSE